MRKMATNVVRSWLETTWGRAAAEEMTTASEVEDLQEECDEALDRVAYLERRLREAEEEVFRLRQVEAQLSATVRKLREMLAVPLV